MNEDLYKELELFLCEKKENKLKKENKEIIRELEKINIKLDIILNRLDAVNFRK